MDTDKEESMWILTIYTKGGGWREYQYESRFRLMTAIEAIVSDRDHDRLHKMTVKWVPGAV